MPPRTVATGNRPAVVSRGKYLRRHGGVERERVTAELAAGPRSPEDGTSRPRSGSDSPRAAGRLEGPLAFHVPDAIAARLAEAAGRRGLSKARLVGEGLDQLLEQYAARLGLAGFAEPAGRVPRGRRSYPGPYTVVTVKLPRRTVQQARGFLSHRREAAVPAAAFDEVTSLSDLVTVAIERQVGVDQP